MLASPEATRFVLGTQSHLFKPTYPKSKERLIGPSAMFFHQGSYHSHLRKLVRAALSPDAIRKMAPQVDSLALFMLDLWSGGCIMNTFHELKKFSFEVGILAVFGELEDHYKEQLRKNYSMVDDGYNSYPTNIPGTPYRKALLARRRLGKILANIVLERKEKRLFHVHLLGSMLNSKDESGEALNLEQVTDNIIGVLFAAQDTTASVMTWILKYLHDNGKLLEALKAEQDGIQRSNQRENRSISWAQTSKMTLTKKVIQETLRMASIISFTYREAVTDVEYKGYLIPKGWKVMPLFRNIHHNLEYFTDPEKFDPSRFEVAPKSSTFMPFGSGTHSCPGSELAKLEILILVHQLVTKFRWEVVGTEHGIQYRPFPVPMHGLPARFWKESTVPEKSGFS
ncbi:hypothetical protein SAY87_010354 [Trapa incisa]|uniref:Uncharacterized protein n=1 Tax=Trapa incisa TaxID=236973 RepID=A0AAN7GW77_9MYRT|nr:hypothetical protein SAY87_010354 [Trapa incisa]